MTSDRVPLTRPVTPVTSVAQGGQAVLAAVQDLLQVYQAMARRNGEKLTASVKALSTAKTPIGNIAAANDLAATGERTSAAFEPKRKPIEPLKAPRSANRSSASSALFP